MGRFWDTDFEDDVVSVIGGDGCFAAQLGFDNETEAIEVADSLVTRGLARRLAGEIEGAPRYQLTTQGLARYKRFQP